MKFLLLGVFVFFASCASNEESEIDMLEGDVAEETELLLDEDSENLQDMEDASMEEEASEEVGDEASEQAMAVTDDMQGLAEGGVAEYRVKEGDTLMLIAFHLYGDYARWRDFLGLNPELQGNQDLSEGQVIRYTPPATPFVWSPEGLPHLIKKGETLGTISMDKYSTIQKWTDIYENNRPMIKNPNLIFAGFTLYYIPAGELAAQ